MARDPRSVACPACFAPANTPCTAPTENGRRPVNYTHYARQHAADAVAAAGKKSGVPQDGDTGGYMVLRGDGVVELVDDMREAEALGIVEHGAVYRITLHRDYRG